MSKLIDYINGNYKVEILEDGTKIRSIENGVIPNPDFPETIDIKITNYCDLANICTYCHEASNANGLHADNEYLFGLSRPSLRGMEWAIGGGNPLSYLYLEDLLSLNKRNGIISNLTVNQLHIVRNFNFLEKYIANELIYGLGISYRKQNISKYIFDLLDQTDNIVWHIIVGVTPFNEIDQLIKNLNCKTKILLLGYKNYRQGIRYLSEHGKEIQSNIEETYRRLPQLFKKDVVVSFDNLAIEQLNVKRLFTDEGWNKFYMGDDGNFSMYIDGVNKIFAKTSTSERILSGNNKSIVEMFKEIKC